MFYRMHLNRRKLARKSEACLPVPTKRYHGISYKSMEKPSYVFFGSNHCRWLDTDIFPNFGKKINLKSVCYLFGCLFLIFLSLPVLFKYSSYLQKHFIFEYDVAVPQNINFSNPENENLQGVLNRYIKTGPDIKVGVWQILPESLSNNVPSLSRGDLDKWYLNQLSDSRPVIVYCHGNQPSRATFHRVAFYKILQKLNYHVITFDYRGFADSTFILPTEHGVVADALEIVRWVRLYSKSELIVWGHSLGTGVGTEAVAQLCQFEKCPNGLVLQSPFTSIADELNNAFMTLPFRFLPWFDNMIIDPLTEQGLTFNNEENIKVVTCPILIIHAEDDPIVPFKLGKKLYNAGKKHRPAKAGLMKFITLSAIFKYGHNDMYKAPEIPKIIANFVSEASKYHPA